MPLMVCLILIWICCPFVFVWSLLDAMEKIKNSETYSKYVFYAGLALLLFVGAPMALLLL